MTATIQVKDVREDDCPDHSPKARILVEKKRAKSPSICQIT